MMRILRADMCQNSDSRYSATASSWLYRKDQYRSHNYIDLMSAVTIQRRRWPQSRKHLVLLLHRCQSLSHRSGHHSAICIAWLYQKWHRHWLHPRYKRYVMRYYTHR